MLRNSLAISENFQDMWLYSVSLSVRCLRMIKADSICDELSSPLFPDLLSEEGLYFTDGKFSFQNFFFVYTFCRSFDFS